MNLSILWFILIGTLFAVFFFLEGIDFGIGMLLPLGSKDKEIYSKIISVIAPVWGANEVWLITAGGALFASFPGWYATMFSGYYIPLFIVLLGLIVRGLGIEFRKKIEMGKFQKAFDFLFFSSNVLVPFILAIAITSLIKGVPINEEMEFTGNLFSVFSIFTILSGVSAVVYFLYLGGTVICIRIPEKISGLNNIINKSGIGAIVLLIVTYVAGIIENNNTYKPATVTAAILSIILLISSYFLYRKKTSKILIGLHAGFVVSTIVAAFSSLFPNVMISSINEKYNLTIYNVSSGNYTLKIISMISVTLLPIIIGYTIWMYYIFRGEIQKDTKY